MLYLNSSIPKNNVSRLIQPGTSSDYQSGLTLLDRTSLHINLNLKLRFLFQL